MGKPVRSVVLECTEGTITLYVDEEGKGRHVIACEQTLGECLEDGNVLEQFLRWCCRLFKPDLVGVAEPKVDVHLKLK